MRERWLKRSHKCWFLAKKVYLHLREKSFLRWIINCLAIFSQKSQCHKFWPGMRRNWKFLVGCSRSSNMLKFKHFSALLFERQWQRNVSKGQKKCRTLIFAPWIYTFLPLSLRPMFSSYFLVSVLLLFENFQLSVDSLIVMVCSHVSNNWVCLFFLSVLPQILNMSLAIIFNMMTFWPH